MRIDLSKCKGFPTEQAAAAKAEKWLGDGEDARAIRWLVAPTGTGRFVPVAFLTGSQTVYVRAMVDAGFYVVG